MVDIESIEKDLDQNEKIIKIFSDSSNNNDYVSQFDYLMRFLLVEINL